MKFYIQSSMTLTPIPRTDVLQIYNIAEKVTYVKIKSYLL